MVVLSNSCERNKRHPHICRYKHKRETLLLLFLNCYEKGTILTRPNLTLINCYLSTETMITELADAKPLVFALISLGFTLCFRI